VSLAKPALASYKRNLRHLQADSQTLFVTFNTYQRWPLPDDARDLVLKHCVHDHGTRYQLHAAVVMPDHVHLLLTPMGDPQANTFGLAEIMSGIKGASAHSVNRLLGRRGKVWQEESFDRVLRSDEPRRAAAEYICANPARAGLAVGEDSWPWVWREWREGASVA
jgi:putative DNA methylase